MYNIFHIVYIFVPRVQ